MREIFLKIGKWLTPIIKDKQVTYSNSSLKQWKERKYGTEWIPVKSYNKGLKFLEVDKDSKRYHKWLANRKGVFYSNACLFQCFSVLWVHEGLWEICFHTNR